MELRGNKRIPIVTVPYNPDSIDRVYQRAREEHMEVQIYRLPESEVQQMELKGWPVHDDPLFEGVSLAGNKARYKGDAW